MAIKAFSRGSFAITQAFLKRLEERQYLRVLSRYGAVGVQALSEATPKDSGLTASSWTYEVKMRDGNPGIFWSNGNVNNGVNIAIILQYGHGTGTGGWVEGVDYINPALKPIFDKLIDDVWREVTR
jgi:hypothetical protein